MLISPEQRRAFQTDGVTLLPGFLEQDEVAAALKLFEWSMDNPGPAAGDLLPGRGGAKQDLVNPAAPAVYEDFLRAAPFSKACKALWDAQNCWFMYEQVFRKDGADGVGRTPWHQDLPYLAIAGDDIAVFWISFEAVPASRSLEFIRGSHKGTLYNGSAFDPDDETKPLYPSADLPRIPPYEAERERHDIVSFGVEPGDVVVFHPAIMHGGAPTPAGSVRRTLSLRFFGDDTVFAKRPYGGGVIVPAMKSLSPGDPFRHESFLELA